MGSSTQDRLVFFGRRGEFRRLPHLLPRPNTT